MGLDNGIIVSVKKGFEEDNSVLFFKEVYSDMLEDDYTEFSTFEVCYWRKYLPLRNEIMDMFRDEGVFSNMEELNIETLTKIKDICMVFINDKNISASTIWSRYCEVICLAKNCAAIEALIDAIEITEYETKDENFLSKIKIEFYDSY